MRQYIDDKDTVHIKDIASRLTFEISIELFVKIRFQLHKRLCTLLRITEGQVKYIINYFNTVLHIL